MGLCLVAKVEYQCCCLREKAIPFLLFLSEVEMLCSLVGFGDAGLSRYPSASSLVMEIFGRMWPRETKLGRDQKLNAHDTQARKTGRGLGDSGPRRRWRRLSARGTQLVLAFTVFGSSWTRAMVTSERIVKRDMTESRFTSHSKTWFYALLIRPPLRSSGTECLVGSFFPVFIFVVSGSQSSRACESSPVRRAEAFVCAFRGLRRLGMWAGRSGRRVFCHDSVTVSCLTCLLI
jgi:hypothetical protein